MCIGRHARGFGDTSVLGPRFCGELELLNTTPSFGGEMALARAAWKDAVLVVGKINFILNDIHNV